MSYRQISETREETGGGAISAGHVSDERQLSRMRGGAIDTAGGVAGLAAVADFAAVAGLAAAAAGFSAGLSAAALSVAGGVFAFGSAGFGGFGRAATAVCGTDAAPTDVVTRF